MLIAPRSEAGRRVVIAARARRRGDRVSVSMSAALGLVIAFCVLTRWFSSVPESIIKHHQY
jgi:hypothetical protein